MVMTHCDMGGAEMITLRLVEGLAGAFRFDLFAVLDHNPAFQQLFFGKVAMSTEDHIADLAAIAAQKEYGSTGDEECAIYRFSGRKAATREAD